MLTLTPLKLDIGSSYNYKTPLDEWVHLDCEFHEHVDIVCDYGKIPLPTESVDAIHIGDVIEHVPPYDYPKVLSEWNRIAKIGCELTGATPNLDRVTKDYAEGKFNLKETVANLYGGSDRPGQIHYTTFTPETFTELLLDYGFEITDLSESPGPKERPWWIVFKGRKVKHVDVYTKTLESLEKGLKVRYV